MAETILRHATSVAIMSTLCGPTWTASCVCGWQGAIRRYQLNERITDAVRDGNDHVRTSGRNETGEATVHPRLGGDRPWMELKCSFGTDPRLCFAPATWHLFWDESENSLTCDEHLAYAEQFAFWDKHPITETCNMPESSVVWSWEEPPGHCAWAMDSDLSQLAGAADIPSMTEAPVSS